MYNQSKPDPYAGQGQTSVAGGAPMTQQPVTAQPTGAPMYGQPGMAGQPRAPVQWMPAPGRVTHCPPGLEYLTQVDQIGVHQIIEMFEELTGWGTHNRYAIKNSVGQQVYYAVEGCSRSPPLTSHITLDTSTVLTIDQSALCSALSTA